MRIDTLDYILDENDDFWIVQLVKQRQDKSLIYLGFKIYEVNEYGNRFNSVTKKNYSKKHITLDDLRQIPNIKQIFKPNKFYLANKNKLTSPWSNFVGVLNEYGINDQNIGIFGSYLIGFDVIKDVDFVVYGKECLNKVYKNIKPIKKDLNSTSITQKHIDYQYEKHKNSYSENADLKNIISRNWSGIQFGEGLLSTIRFIDNENMYMPVVESKKEQVECKVTSWLESACIPRMAKVLFEGEEYNFYASQWKYQSCFRQGDKVLMFARVDRKNKNIVLQEKEDYIKFI